MKTRYAAIAIALFLTACSWSDPTATVKTFIAAAEKGEVDAMNKLFSGEAVKRLGADRIMTNNQNFATMSQKAIAGGGNLQMDDIKQTIDGNKAQVSFLYRNVKVNDSLKVVFDLVKENGSWMIDNIGDSDKENTGEVPADTPTLVESVPPPPKGVPISKASPGVSPPKVVSGGILNGKAISLPKPDYPPAARVAKASGTVMVQVTIDETGKVISATAVSGHPLLRASCQSAARQAKFTPALLSGQPVKVTGTLVYNFAAN